jgi:uncharacterized damage-inducible protein DinB
MPIPVPRPQTDEYGAYYGQYIQRILAGEDLWAVLAQQPDQLTQLVANLSEEATSQPPAPGEWSIKEVLGHLTDAERILAYRALRVARNDSTPIEGFEQDDYVAATDFNARSLSSLLEEFRALRHANRLCFEALSLEELARRGTASNAPVSTRALLYLIAGHMRHHLESLQRDYALAS